MEILVFSMAISMISKVISVILRNPVTLHVRPKTAFLGSGRPGKGLRVVWFATRWRTRMKYTTGEKNQSLKNGPVSPNAIILPSACLFVGLKHLLPCYKMICRLRISTKRVCFTTIANILQ